MIPTHRRIVIGERSLLGGYLPLRGFHKSDDIPSMKGRNRRTVISGRIWGHLKSIAGFAVEASAFGESGFLGEDYAILFADPTEPVVVWLEDNAAGLWVLTYNHTIVGREYFNVWFQDETDATMFKVAGIAHQGGI